MYIPVKKLRKSSMTFLIGVGLILTTLTSELHFLTAMCSQVGFDVGAKKIRLTSCDRFEDDHFA